MTDRDRDRDQDLELDGHGRLDLDGAEPVLRFVRRLPHPPEKVWRALTEPEHLRNWFPTDIHGERRAGATLRFAFREGEGPELEGEMLAYEPHRLLELRWGDDEVLRFELTPIEDGAATELRFANTFAAVGKAARDGAGWHHCLDALAADLDGRPKAEDRWREVHDWYVANLPPEASTIGPPG